MSHALQVLLLLALVIAAAKAAGAAANRIGQPAVFGEILIGLILGPTLFDLLAWPVFSPGAESLGELIGALAEIGGCSSCSSPAWRPTSPRCGGSAGSRSGQPWAA
jgi:Kef-type K+ transport system membrane component KefB